jgi:hypothetical protein
MTKFFAVCVALSSYASVAQAAELESQQPSVQSVYRTERTIEVMNYDGTVSETTIVTRYYILGVE